jgi:hypothetical protein
MTGKGLPEGTLAQSTEGVLQSINCSLILQYGFSDLFYEGKLRMEYTLFYINMCYSSKTN